MLRLNLFRWLSSAQPIVAALPIIALLTLSSAAHANEFCPERPLKLALFEFGIFLDASSMKGLDPDLIALLQRRTGCRIDGEVMPRARHWVEMREGTVDMVTAAIPTAERDKFMYSLPYIRTRNVMILGSAVPAAIKDFKSFLEASELKLGVVRGFRHEPALDEFIASLRAAGRVREEADSNLLFQALAAGTVEAVPAEPLVYPGNLKRNGLTGKVRIGDWLPRDQYAKGVLGLSRRTFTDAQVARWRSLLKNLLDEGTLQRLGSTYLSADEARSMFTPNIAD